MQCSLLFIYFYIMIVVINLKRIFNFIILLVLIACLYYTYQNKDDIINYLDDNYVDKKTITLKEPNSYKRDYDFNYVQNTDNFYPNNYNELLNSFYTILNNGYEDFTFYCSDEYDCLDDVEMLTKDNTILSNINNFVHPYNSYNSILINSNNSKKIVVKVDKMYSEEDINIIDSKVDSVISSLIKPNMSDGDKIKVIHDYIVNNTKYDTKKERTVYYNGLTEYKYSSNKATGPILYNLAICSGYTDYMEIFLEKLGIKSYKISSDNHIWNYIYLDNKWLHLDLTWDDPINYNGKDTIIYDYYLIDTAKLNSLDTTEHTFDKNIFSET